MLQKSPKHKLTDLSTIKDRQRYFKTLTEEVNKSRMAVVIFYFIQETITSFKNSQLNFKKKIDEIQDELQSSISRINLESKKNVSFYIKLGCSKTAHQPDEGINVQFPKNTKKIGRKK